MLDSTARGLEAKERTLRQRQQDPSSIGNLGEATRQLQTELSWQREVEGHQEQVVAALDRLRQANSGLPPEATGYRIEPVRWGPQN